MNSRADQAEDLTLLDVEGEPIERDDAPERNRDVVDFQERHVVFSPLATVMADRVIRHVWAATVAA